VLGVEVVTEIDVAADGPAFIGADEAAVETLNAVEPTVLQKFSTFVS